MALKSLGRCGICRQTIYETDSGNLVGHTDNCPRKGQGPN